jgi:hypothetical protein
MPDILFSLLITRDSLGLPDLDLNDHLNYYVADQFMGGQVTWNRNQVTSPFIDGAITTYRTKQMVTDTVNIEVLTTTYTGAMTSLRTLVQAFTQDTYNLQIGIGVSTAALQYQCEAADYTMDWTNSRWVAKHLSISFSVPRNPVPILGPV